MTNRRYAFGFENRYRMTGRPFGITSANALILVTDRHLRVSFGPWQVRTELDNISSVAIAGPYKYYKTIRSG